MHYTRNGTSLRRDKSERAPIQSPDFDVAAPPAFPSFSSQVGLAFLVATERIKRWSVFNFLEKTRISLVPIPYKPSFLFWLRSICFIRPVQLLYKCIAVKNPVNNLWVTQVVLSLKAPNFK